MIDIAVKEAPNTRWGLYVNGVLIGDSKNRYDADFSAKMLRQALDSPQEAKTPGTVQDAVNRKEA